METVEYVLEVYDRETDRFVYQIDEYDTIDEAISSSVSYAIDDVNKFVIDEIIYDPKTDEEISINRIWEDGEYEC